MKITTTKQLRTILNGVVECNLDYPTFLHRRHDDTDGSTMPEHQITVSQGPDGDMYICQGDDMMLRFRTYEGGGNSLAVHNALRILAEAIKMDNERRPQYN